MTQIVNPNSRDPPEKETRKQMKNLWRQATGGRDFNPGKATEGRAEFTFLSTVFRVNC